MRWRAPRCPDAAHPHAFTPEHNMEGKGGREERHTVLLELSVTLFHMVLLRKKQDWIAC